MVINYVNNYICDSDNISFKLDDVYVKDSEMILKFKIVNYV